MRRRRLAAFAALAVAAAAIGTTSLHSSPHARLWFGSRFLTVANNAVTLNWAGVTVANQTGYFVLVNGVQQADITATSYQFTGLDCGTTYTLGVEAHNGSGQTGSLFTTSYTSPDCQTFPLQVSTDGRSLVTASGRPFLIVGDSPQALIGNLSVTTANSYLDDRQAHGFNAVWINLLCASYTFCNNNGQAVGDGSGSIAPFTSAGANPPGTYSFGSGTCGNCNSSYFSRAHSIVAHAQSDGIAVFLDPIEVSGCSGNNTGWDTTLINNGDGTDSTSDADYKYGQYLGTTFGDLHNIIWMAGNDFQCLSSSTATNNDAQSVMNGIRNTDSSALQTMEPDYCSSLGFNCEGSSSITAATGTSTGWSSIVDLNASYTYAAAYAQDRLARTQAAKPMFLVESDYEGEALGNTDGCQTVRNCRLQEWWTMTSGAAGQLYGNYWTDAIGCGGATTSSCTGHGGGSGTPPANSFSTANIDSTGVTQLGYLTALLDTISWQNLAPDSNGAGHLVTSGGGTCPTTGSFASNNCVTASIDSGGTVALIFDPQGTSITVDLSKFAGTTTAKWYDPADGQYTTATGSPFTNSGTHSFTVPSANNSAGTGNPDWVLLLQS